ncbi:alpha/beta-hydrolase [Rhizodiscina lignyota]|uniref:Alpha/beta-hydrolase n=1 Tax=Rhizodiscina lignyota TaxID=1504668 RepID=A0A9P4ICT6_9PEZI|nr:alpha/beta-hydrolase [Rhizodiscina lignyota]
MDYKIIQTPILNIAYYEHGPQDGWPVVLSHGFPYDVHAYDEVVPILVKNGARVIVPYLRGYGPTRFVSSTTMRAGQQAALGSDLISLLDALSIKKAVLAGFDWGGLASCVAAALWPKRVAGLVSYAGYDVVNRADQKRPCDPELECVMWYQHLFQSERGKECLSLSRHKLCKILWQQWSPTWNFSEEVYNRTATSFDNPDFVDVVVGTYRHVLGTEDGDPALEHLEEKLAARLKISVPTVTLDGEVDPLKPGGSATHDQMFSGKHERFVYENVGHAFPSEAPEAFAKAITLVHQWASENPAE